jgi:hypothetical protein
VENTYSLRERSPRVLDEQEEARQCGGGRATSHRYGWTRQAGTGSNALARHVLVRKKRAPPPPDHHPRLMLRRIHSSGTVPTAPPWAITQSNHTRQAADVNCGNYVFCVVISDDCAAIDDRKPRHLNRPRKRYRAAVARRPIVSTVADRRRVWGLGASSTGELGPGWCLRHFLAPPPRACP